MQYKQNKHKSLRWIIPSFFITLFLFLPSITNAALIDQVNQAFREVWGRTPTFTEWSYWAGRVERGEKTSYVDLVGAIAYQKGTSSTTTTSIAITPVTVASVSTFKVSPSAYPSPFNPNFLGEGALVKSVSAPQVFYIQNGKKSWVLPSILDTWLGENHFFKHDIITTISDADLALYPQTKSVNPVYIGKILRAPDGTQYFIDDRLRKRHISLSVRSALKIPAGNLYSASSVHLSEFPTGPAITTASKYVGGMVVYDGPYHGGRIWRIEEAANGVLQKRLYLSDYLYEAHYNPDESLRSPAILSILDSHQRGPNIERYPDGWVVGLNTAVYVVQNQALRHISSPELFAAMGYKQKYILTQFPEFLARYPRGNAITAFKSISNGSGTIISAAPAPSTSVNLTKVRPHIRTIISEMNTIYLSVFDKDVTASENKFWVDYIYNGEVNTKTDLIAVMERTRVTGTKPPLTSRTAVLSESLLESKWFPYLFYFVHQQEPSDAAKAYWYGRIRPGDRDTIEKLGGTLQWIKENYGTTHR